MVKCVKRNFVETIRCRKYPALFRRQDSRARRMEKNVETCDERKLLPREMRNVFCRTRAPVCVRSRYIIQVIRDGNADIVTSIPLEKETPAALRE